MKQFIYKVYSVPPAQGFETFFLLRTPGFIKGTG
jgi:hypothetical protein